MTLKTKKGTLITAYNEGDTVRGNADTELIAEFASALESQVSFTIKSCGRMKPKVIAKEGEQSVILGKMGSYGTGEFQLTPSGRGYPSRPMKYLLAVSDSPTEAEPAPKPVTKPAPASVPSPAPVPPPGEDSAKLQKQIDDLQAALAREQSKYDALKQALADLKDTDDALEAAKREKAKKKEDIERLRSDSCQLDLDIADYEA